MHELIPPNTNPGVLAYWTLCFSRQGIEGIPGFSPLQPSHNTLTLGRLLVNQLSSNSAPVCGLRDWSTHGLSTVSKSNGVWMAQMGHQIHSGVRHGWTWVLLHSPTLPSTQIPSTCHSAKPAGQMDMHTALIKASAKPSSSHKMYAWPKVVRHTTEVWGGVSCSPRQESLDYLWDA